MSKIVYRGSLNSRLRTWRRAGLCLSAALILAAQASGAFAQTLREAVMISLAQYPAILAAQSRIEAADADIARAGGAHWPQLAWSGTRNVYEASGLPNNWVQSPTVSINVWSGGKIQADVERSRALSESSRQQQRITRDEVALLATEGYLNWARAIDLTSLARENVAAHQKIRDDILKITQVDQGRRIDLDQAQVRLENAQLSLEQRQAELAAAVQRLNRMLLGQMPARPAGIDVAPGAVPETPDQALAAIDDTHPVIAQQIAQVEAARAGVHSARSQHSPTINASYGKQAYPGSIHGDYVAQLSVSVPIFSGGAASGAVNTARGQQQAAEYALEEARLLQREKLLSAWSEWTAAQSRSRLGARQVLTGQVLVEGYFKQFQVGRRSLLDLLNVQSDLYSYRNNAVSAGYDETVARARVTAAIGKLAAAYQSGAARSAQSASGAALPLSLAARDTRNP